MVSWFATIAFCVFSLYKPVVCSITLNEGALPQSDLESMEEHVSAKPRDGAQYYLSIKPFPYHRVATHGKNMFIYNGGYYMDQLWELEEDRWKKGYYLIHSVPHKGCRFSDKNDGGMKYMNCGGRSVIDLFRFQQTGNYYFIVSYATGQKFASHKTGPLFLYRGPEYDDQKFFLTPRFDIGVSEKVIWKSDNREGSKAHPSPKWEYEVGVSVTKSTSFEVGLSVTKTLEVGVEGAYGGVGLSASASASLTADMRSSMSREETKTWTHKVTVGPYSAPAGKYYKIITYEAAGKGKMGDAFFFIPERTCTIECSGYHNCPPEFHNCNFSSDTGGIVYKGLNQTSEEDESNNIL